MKKKERLFTYLKKQAKGHYISAKDLAKLLDVSDRMVRNYIKQLKEDNLITIETSHEGYRINLETMAESPGELANDQSVEGRRFKLLRDLIQSGDNGLDLFELSEEAWVSDATIRSDIVSLQSIAQNYDLKIHQHDFRYFLSGDDKKKREMIMDLIRQPAKEYSSLEQEMQKFLGEIPLNELADICKKAFLEHNFQTNNYFIQNFILHLIISLNQKGNSQIEEIASPSLTMIEDIGVWIGRNYNIKLAQSDKYELALMCDLEKGNNGKSINGYVSHKVSKAVATSLEELTETFLVDFKDQQFLARLLLHTQNLYNRVTNNKVKRNLSATDIKIQYPVLFDIAVYMSSLIENKLDIDIGEDEIAFLALHLGSFIAEQKKNSNKIRAFIETSSYLDHAERLQNILLDKFGEELLFVSDSDQAELIVSSLDSTFKGNRVIKILEFATERDFIKINQEILHIKQNHYEHYLREILPHLFTEEAYIELEDSLNKKEVFQRIGTWFEMYGYTKEGYAHKLMERENMSSTVFFSGIAIPHTIKYEAKKTGFLVVHPQTNFLWNGQKITLIIAIAVCQADSHDFNRIFPRMIECLVEEYHVRQLKTCTSRLSFLNYLIELMIADGYYNN